MMKRKFLVYTRHWPWLLLLLWTDGLAVLLLWVADVQALGVLTAVIVLATVLTFVAVLFVLGRLEQKRMHAFETFLSFPDAYHEGKLRETVSASEAQAVHLLCLTLQEKQNAYNQLAAELADYKQYVETWAHETKTPLSLLTLMLDNRRDELSETMSFKLDYIRNRMQESVNQMLYYARLKGLQKDYLFEHIDIRTCVDEVLEDYHPLLEEKSFQLDLQVPHVQVFTDRRGIIFLLGQVISNAVKYSSQAPRLSVRLQQVPDADVLIIQGNGIGVRSCDLPYIFGKGFTGDSADSRKKATGMGLYLSQKIANDLNLRLDVQSEWGKGFQMQITFPKVDGSAA